MSGICAVLAESAALFAACLTLHVMVWRVRRPTSYRQWLPMLAALFLVVGPAVAWRLPCFVACANTPIAAAAAITTPSRKVAVSVVIPG